MEREGSLLCFSRVHGWHPHILFIIHVNVILHLRLGLPSVLFPLCYPTEVLYVFVISLMHATCPLIWSLSLCMVGSAHYLGYQTD
jgi:hypothetical protein